MKRTTKGLVVIALIALSFGIVFGLRNKSSQPKPTAASQPLTSSQSQTAKPQTAAPVFDKKQYSVDDPTSIWIVVNKQRPLNPLSYAPNDLTSVGAGQYLRAEAANSYQQLVAAAAKAGYTLVPESGYRSYNTQVVVYGNEVKNFGQATADTESARPGHSEHQTGLAMDIATPGCVEDCFGSTPAAKWVLDNAASFGFVQRYAPDKSAITGYRHEPWHFRYVGTALAQELAKNKQTLEEFFGLPAAPSY